MYFKLAYVAKSIHNNVIFLVLSSRNPFFGSNDWEMYVIFFCQWCKLSIDLFDRNYANSFRWRTNNWGPKKLRGCTITMAAKATTAAAAMKATSPHHCCHCSKNIRKSISGYNRLSVINNSVDSRTAAAGNVAAAVVAHVARSGRSRTNAVICNWKKDYGSRKTGKGKLWNSTVWKTNPVSRVNPWYTDVHNIINQLHSIDAFSATFLNYQKFCIENQHHFYYILRFFYSKYSNYVKKCGTQKLRIVGGGVTPPPADPFPGPG